MSPRPAESLEQKEEDDDYAASTTLPNEAAPRRLLESEPLRDGLDVLNQHIESGAEKRGISETPQTPSSREPTPTLEKENQWSIEKLPEAPLTQALLSRLNLDTIMPCDQHLRTRLLNPRNPLSATSSVFPQAPIPEAILLYRRKPSLLLGLKHYRTASELSNRSVPAGQVAVIHYEQPGASTLAISVKCPLGRLEIHHLLRSTHPLNSQPTFGFQQPFQLSFQQPFQPGRVPDNQTTCGDIILEYFISDTTTIPRILIAPPPDFDPTARCQSKRLVKLLLNHGADPKTSQCGSKDDGGLHFGG
ncbi:hypothetical protein FRC01_005295 [Tulasnella sp. 417]|nr:hypothetical protein FRC01_005295 [Tulasnella sp. 417]